MCLATMKLEEGKRKSTSMAMVNANIAAVIAEMLEKYRSQIMKEVNALIVDILDTFAQTTATSDGETSCQSNQKRDRDLGRTLDGSEGSESLNDESNLLCLKMPVLSAGSETHKDGNSKIDKLNENTCVVEITVDSDESETVWLDDYSETVNLNDEEHPNNFNGKTYVLGKIPTENIVIESDVPELLWLNNDCKPINVDDEPLRGKFAAPLDHTYQLFKSPAKQTRRSDTDAEVALDSKKSKVQRKRSQLSSKDTSVEKRVDETGSATRISDPSKGRTRKPSVSRASYRSLNLTKSPGGERLTFRCEICNKQYKYKCDLKFHEFSHEGKLFQCGVCGKSFNHPANKRNHERLHNPNERFECATCGRMFTQKGNLKLHIIRWHGDRKQKKPRFRCEFCGKRYHQNRSYKGHLPKCEQREQKREQPVSKTNAIPLYEYF